LHFYAERERILHGRAAVWNVVRIEEEQVKAPMPRIRLRLAVLPLLAALIALLGAGPAAATPPTVFNPVQEAQNFSITQQRQAIYDTPQYQTQLAIDSQTNTENALAIQAADPGRFFTDDLCWNQGNGCAGDIRLYNWGPNGYGLVRPVLFTARNGATLSGHVWATVAGPAKRPGIVITNGSVQADEQMYWYAAQTLAKEGYVVLTFDPQGQGQSDTFGQSPDQNEGYPAQSDGRPFYDGTEDAINFLLSSPRHRYEPVTSCNTGTSHAAKQNARVKAGLDAAYNPFWSLLNGGEIGLVGHSYGAAGVSYIAQWDPRVGAVVALDNLGGPGPDAGSVPGSGGHQTIGEAGCPARPADRTVVPITKPALGISADYGLPPTPNTSLPDPNAKAQESHVYSGAGVDSGEIVIRGGSHLDFSWIPNQAFGASLRGPDITDWYATAWFDKYLRHEASADNWLRTQRWRTDPVEAGVDPNHDPNAFSFYYYARLNIHLASGQRWDCEDLRDGCAGMVSNDGYPGDYSYIKIDTTPDSLTGGGAGLRSGNGLATCPAHSAIRLRLQKIHGRAIKRVKIYVDGKLVGTRHGRSIRSVKLAGLPGKARHHVRLLLYTRHGLAKRVKRTVYGCRHKAKSHEHAKTRPHRRHKDRDGDYDGD
jgi:dienelactone hydrolase